MNKNSLVCGSIRVMYIGIMDMLCRYSYQYLAWFSYVFRTLGILSVVVILMLPYRHLVVVFRYMTSLVVLGLVWMLHWFQADAVQQTFETSYLAALVLTQCVFMLITYHICNINTWTRFYVYICVLLVIGEILGLGFGWRKDVFFVCFMLLSVASFSTLFQHDCEILTFEQGKQLEEYLRNFRLDSVSRAFKNREFVIYFTMQFLVTDIFFTFKNENFSVKEILRLTLGTCCSSILSVKALISTVSTVYEVSVKFCYKVINGVNRNREDILLFSEYSINIYLFSADLFLYDLKPIERGLIVESRLVLLLVCLMEACFLVIGIECTEAGVLLGSKFTLKVIIIHFMFNSLTSLLIYTIFTYCSFQDMGTLLTMSILICLFMRTLISVFNFALCKIDSMKEEFWEEYDDLMFNTHVISSTIYITVYSVTAAFAVWILLYGQYTLLDLFRLLALCQMNIYNSIQNLKNVLHQRHSVNKYTKELEDTFLLPHADESVCSICLQKMSSSKITPCRHVFHEICLRKWLNSRETWSCPLCKSEFHAE